jgi:hypothetical protein
MSAAPAAFGKPWEEIPSFASPLRPWLKHHADLHCLWARLRETPLAYAAIGYFSTKASAQDMTASPGETWSQFRKSELEQALLCCTRSVEMTIKTLVEKEFIELRSEPKTSGYYSIRLLVNNWRQGPGEPGAPIPPTKGKPKTRAASVEFVLPKAALAQPAAPQLPLNPSQAVQGEELNHLAKPAAQDDAQPISQAQYLALGFRFDPFTGEPLGDAQPAAHARTSGEHAQPAAAHHTASGSSPLRIPAQTKVENPETGFAHPIRERLYGREEESLASAAQPGAEAELAQLLAEKCIEVPNERTRRNLLDRNRYEGPGLPGPRAVAAFIVLNHDRPSWNDAATGQLKWGVVIKSVREDMMPSLCAQGWPSEGLTVAEDPASGVLPGTEKARESINRRRAILKALRPDLE